MTFHVDHTAVDVDRNGQKRFTLQEFAKQAEVDLPYLSPLIESSPQPVKSPPYACHWQPAEPQTLGLRAPVPALGGRGGSNAATPPPRPPTRAAIKSQNAWQRQRRGYATPLPTMPGRNQVKNLSPNFSRGCQLKPLSPNLYPAPGRKALFLT